MHSDQLTALQDRNQSELRTQKVNNSQEVELIKTETSNEENCRNLNSKSQLNTNSNEIIASSDPLSTTGSRPGIGSSSAQHQLPQNQLQNTACVELPHGPRIGSSSAGAMTQNLLVSSQQQSSANVANANPTQSNGEKPKRNPFCSRCRNHGKSAQVKGHKRHCEYRKCQCEGCKLVECRQIVSAAQIKRRRYQKQDEECGHRIEVSPPKLVSDSRDNSASTIAEKLLRSNACSVADASLALRRRVRFSGPMSSASSNCGSPCAVESIDDNIAESLRSANPLLHRAEDISKQISIAWPPAMTSLSMRHNLQMNPAHFYSHGNVAQSQQLATLNNQIAAIRCPTSLAGYDSQNFNSVFGRQLAQLWTDPAQQTQQPPQPHSVLHGNQTAQDSYSSIFHNPPASLPSHQSAVASSRLGANSANCSLGAAPSAVSKSAALSNVALLSQHVQQSGLGPSNSNSLNPARSFCSGAHSPHSGVLKDQVMLASELQQQFGVLAIFAWLKSEEFDESRVRAAIEAARPSFHEILVRLGARSPLDLTRIDAD